MRRYGTTTDATIVPGKDAGLAITLQPLAEACAEVVAPTPCAPSITGLHWFSDATGLIDQDAEAAYILPEGAAGPMLGLAKLVGEPCDLPVTWTKEWEATTGTGGDPGYLEEGASLIVYPLATTVPGILSVTAEHGGTSYGPILLTVLKYACYVPNQLGGWFRLTDNYSYSSYTGTITQYGGSDGSLLIGANAVTTINFTSISSATKIWIYCNDGSSGYYKVNGDGVTRYPQRGSFSPPWSGSGTPVTISGLTSLELHSDGYNAPWYVFVK